jgi:hypothetical protein
MYRLQYGDMSKRAIAVLYFGVCAIEGLWPLFFLWKPNQSGSAFLGFSLPRLILIASIALAVVLLIALAASEWLIKANQDTRFERWLNHPFLILLSFFLFIACLIFVYLLVFSPLQIDHLYGYSRRWRPVFVWGMLIAIQFFGLAFFLKGPAYWAERLRDFINDGRTQKLRSSLNSPTAGITLLGISFLIALTKVYYGRFVDEGDNLAVGWLLSQGSILYRDVFSHHFPFAYYWVAGIVHIFGNSFEAVRISVMLLQIGLFAVGMLLTRFYLVLGLTSLVWNLINQFQRGQEVLYVTFESIMMVTIFALIFSILTHKAEQKNRILVLTGLLLALSILTDPLMVYPALVAFAALFISGAASYPPQRLQGGLRRILPAAIAAILILGIYALYLVWSGTVQDFYRDTIWFNAEVYAKYENADPNRLGQIGQNLISGLNILRPKYYQQPSPFLALDTNQSIGLAVESGYSKWIFSSFLFRVSILACVLALLLQGQFGVGAFLYLFATTLLVRGNTGLYTTGFTLVSIFAGFYLLVELRRPRILPTSQHDKSRIALLIRNIMQAGWFSAILVIGLMWCFAAFRGGYFLVDHWDTLMDNPQVTVNEKLGASIHAATCNQKDVQILYYPTNPMVYFVTEIPPASKYGFMYPWVAEIGQQELIDELRQNPAAVILINTSRKAGKPQAVTTYLADTIQFLNQNYVYWDANKWMSPQLASLCSVKPVQNPANQAISSNP